MHTNYGLSNDALSASKHYYDNNNFIVTAGVSPALKRNIKTLRGDIKRFMEKYTYFLQNSFENISQESKPRSLVVCCFYTIHNSSNNNS